jgi:hypothetical protein
MAFREFIGGIVQTVRPPNVLLCIVAINLSEMLSSPGCGRLTYLKVFARLFLSSSLLFLQSFHGDLGHA